MNKMEQGEDKDYFLLLEEKIETLINHIQTLREEKRSLLEKVKTITLELDHVKGANDHAKNRMVSLLQKIDQLKL